jgi:hypothetical protein
MKNGLKILIKKIKMKKVITIIVLLLVVVACKEENNPLTKIKGAVDNAKEIKQGIDNVSEVTKNLEGIQANIEKLSALTPVTKAEVKTWMPEDINDLKRTEYTIGGQMGMSSFKFTFKGEDGKMIKITISDGAGKGSALVSMFSMLQNIEIDKENESGYERTQTLDGQPMLVKYQSSENYEKSTLQCLFNNRFGIEANAWKMTPDELWSYIKKLQIDKLIE